MSPSKAAASSRIQAGVHSAKQSNGDEVQFIGMKASASVSVSSTGSPRKAIRPTKGSTAGKQPLHRTNSDSDYDMLEEKISDSEDDAPTSSPSILSSKPSQSVTSIRTQVQPITPSRRQERGTLYNATPSSSNDPSDVAVITPPPSTRKRDSVSRPASPTPHESPSKVPRIMGNESISSPPMNVTIRRSRNTPEITSNSGTRREKKIFPSFKSKGPLFPSAPKSKADDNMLVDNDDVFASDSSLKVQVNRPPAQKEYKMFDVPESSSTQTISPLVTTSAEVTRTSVSSPSPSASLVTGTSTVSTSVPSTSDESFISYLFKDSLMGVQFELARGVTVGAWDWAAVRNKLPDLTGDEESILPQVDHIMRGTPYQPSATTCRTAKQLQLEQAAIMENKNRGLGLMEEQNWYGGQIQQIGHVVQCGERGSASYRVVIQPLTQTKSTRFARFLGSRRLFQLRVSDRLAQNDKDEINEFLSQKFVLCGRVFVPWVAKEGSLYLVECEENYERESCKWCGDQFRKTYASILEWHNPPQGNDSQPLAKYVTRNVLGLSTSVPALLFEDENIFHIEDEAAVDWTGGNKKIPSNKLMTDGCGFMNREALTLITRNLGLRHRPSAVQARIAGNKGLWIMHPEDITDVPRIWIRDSQHKIIHARPYKYSHRILDVVSIGNPPSAVSLSAQSIMNLSYNGIGDDIFKKLMKEGLERLIAPLTKDGCTGQLAKPALWQAVAQAGGITGSRVQRHAAGLSRVLGLTGRDFNKSVTYDDIQKPFEPQGDVYTGRKLFSDEPITLAETIIEMVQAGFEPQKSPVLHRKLEYFIKMVIDSALEGYHIPLPDGKSVEAFVIPDPSPKEKRKLKKGQVFYCASEPMVDPDTGRLFNIPVGPAIMGRYPIRLASDIQKIEVVDVPELHDYKDVIVVNVDGYESLMTWLSGGDTAFLIWLNELVADFQNKPLRREPPNFLSSYFKRNIESVAQFGKRVQGLSSATGQKEYIGAQLVGFSQGRVGIYSTFHDYAVWRYGIDSPDAILLAYMFNTILDSGKTGHIMKEEVFQEHQGKYGKTRPLCFTSRGDKKPCPHGPFILETLMEFGERLGQDMQGAYKRQAVLSDVDADLHRLWLDEVRMTTAPPDSPEIVLTICKARKEDLERIREHVNLAYKEYCQAARTTDLSSPSKSPMKSPAKGKRVPKDDVMMTAIKLFWEDVPGLIVVSQHEARRLKAECAYCGSFKNADSSLDITLRTAPKDRFAFSMAFGMLCALKAEASSDGFSVSVRDIDELRAMSGPARKLLEAVEIYS
ncbi:hypothetical protein BDZ89DRAFT_1068052 [Hymenopellis radicata]|nr:hypothetical protein BDZ89DRAFT_1068052 [Hymenopellis radicata]